MKPLAVVTLLVIAMGLAPAIAAQAPVKEFGKAKLMVQQGDKTKEKDATIRFAADKFEVREKGVADAAKSYPYSAITSAEYSYAKTVRWTSGLLISPLLFLSSGKKHWLLVKSADDYAMLVMDGDNYRVILAELETRAKIKVVTVADSK